MDLIYVIESQPSIFHLWLCSRSPLINSIYTVYTHIRNSQCIGYHVLILCMYPIQESPGMPILTSGLPWRAVQLQHATQSISVIVELGTVIGCLREGSLEATRPNTTTTRLPLSIKYIITYLASFLSHNRPYSYTVWYWTTSTYICN